MTILIRGTQDATATDLRGRSTSNARGGFGGLPPSISRDEIGYWTTRWKAGHLESEKARAAGESVVFDSGDPNDIVRWLLSSDD